MPGHCSPGDTARVGVYLARTVPSGDGVELENARALQRLGARAFVKLLPLRNKGRMTELLSRMPVHVIMNPNVGLLGAAAVAGREET